jgi:hypothetical protein
MPFVTFSNDNVLQYIETSSIIGAKLASLPDQKPLVRIFTVRADFDVEVTCDSEETARRLIETVLGSDANKAKSINEMIAKNTPIRRSTGGSTTVIR